MVLGFLAGVRAPATAQGWPSDPWLEEAVGDEAFETFLDFFAYDAALPLEPTTFAVTTTDGIQRRHLSFQSTPGERVYAHYYSPVAGASGRPAVVLIHGGNALGKDFAGDGLGHALVRAGFNVLMLDMKYFGERRTTLLTTFSEADKHEHLYNRPSTYLAWVAQTVKDAGRAYDFLVAEMEVAPDRIALLGFSRGAQVGTVVGGADPRFAAVALAYGGHFDRSENEHRAPACPANFIGRISPRPLFLLNGRFDSDYDPDRSVRPLHALARAPVEIQWLDTGHSLPDEAVELTAQWLRRQLY